MLSPQITCRKINGLWSFDEQFRDGSYVTNEPLMHQATALIDKVLLSKYETIPEEIEITYDIDPIYKPSKMMYSGEPYLFDYKENIKQDLKYAQENVIVKNHVIMWTFNCKNIN